MGRAVQQTNPFEMDSGWTPTGDDVAGYQFNVANTFDWKGRPLKSYNMDGSYKEASYAGCGCAGGEVTTLTDEGTIEAGVAKRRQQKIYADVLGRTIKTELLNWEGGTVYATTVNTYNGRDQVTLVRQYMGVEGSATYQDTSMTYDGFGRLKTKHVPEQQVDPNNSASTDHTTWTYKPDDMIESVTDARGATTSYGYNNRHQITAISYVAPSGIAATSAESFAYDEAGNRISMADGSGSTSYNYDQLSRIEAETKHFNDYIPQAPLPNNSFTISYEYNLAGQLRTIVAPYGDHFDYTIDNAGRITAVAGPPMTWGPRDYVSNVKYRASGQMKSADYPNAIGFGVGCFAGIAVSQTFDNRLRPASYDVYENPSQYCATGSLLKKEYQYYDDGSLRYVKDDVIAAYDRSQEYDHLTRLTKVRTASEAQGTGTVFNYRQNFSYDVWNNTLSRQMTTTSSDETQTYTYLNNRATSLVNSQATPWQYDADGRIVNDTHTAYSNDAAGQVVGTQVPDEYVMARTNDGDGLSVKQEVGETTPDRPVYLIRSTVLNGRIITQTPAVAGESPRTSVYLFGKLLAYKFTNSGAAYWQFQEPSGTTVLDDDGGYHSVRRMELDPTGAVVYDDYEANQTFYGGRYFDSWTLGLDGFGGSPFGGSSCFMDGFEANCGRVMQSLELGIVDQCQGIDCGPAIAVIRRNSDGSTRRVLVPLSHDFNTGELGYFPEQWGLMDSPSVASRITEIAEWAENQVRQNYDACKKTLGGSPEPGKSQAAKILGVSVIERTPAVLLAVTWGSEATDQQTHLFDEYPVANYRPGDNGWDVGPGQTSTTYYNKPRFTEGLPLAFGNNFSESARFNGDPFQNLRATARAYSLDIIPRARSLADAAGLFRAGRRTDPKTRQEDSRYRARVTQFNDLEGGYSNFFECLRNGPKKK
jgi:hypothetical protein